MFCEVFGRLSISFSRTYKKKLALPKTYKHHIPFLANHYLCLGRIQNSEVTSMDTSFPRRAMFHKLTLFLYLVLGIFFLVRAAIACDCPAPSIQARFEQADTILVVKIMGHRGLMRHMVSTDVRVIKAYKGSVSVGEKIVLGDSADAREDTCRIWFADESPGGRWLIFAKSAEDRQKGRWLIRNCGRSSPVEFAKHDLNYLDRIDKYRGRTRIYGFAGSNKVTYASRSMHGAVSRGPGMQLTFHGGGHEFAVRASADGFFEVMDVPPGLYKAILESPEGVPFGYPYRAFYVPASGVEAGIDNYGPFSLTVNATDQERAKGVYNIHVPDSGDAEINFSNYLSNRIRGRVFGPDGRPLPHALVSLSTYNSATVYNYTVLADENGRYEISGHLPGIYVLGVNLRNSVSPDHPYGPLYYPGIASRARSRVIQLGAETVIDDADFHIPAFRSLVTLSGRLVFADGSPVTDGFVRFWRDGRFQAEYDEIKTRLTSNGRFRIRAVRRSRGTLMGGVTMVSQGLGGCVNKTQPMVDNDFQKGFTRLFSEEKSVTANRNISGLVLKLRQRPCK
jgi:hypothetical protein